MSFTSVSLSISWWVVAVAFLTGSFCLFSSFQTLHHRTGAYGHRNLLVLLASALLYTIALFTSAVLTLLSLSFSSLPSPSLPLTIDPGLACLAFLLPLIFVLFGLFLSGHPDSHRYLRRPIGVLSTAAGTTASQFLLMQAMRLQATFTLDQSYVIGIVVAGMVAVPIVLYLTLTLQHRHQSRLWSRLLLSLLLGVCIETLHVLTIKAMTWTYDDSITTSNPIQPLLYPLIAVSALSVLAVAASGLFTRLSAREDVRATQCFSLSCYMMDGAGRVLVTSSGVLPSIRIENVYVGQGRFDAYNKDFLRMLQTSVHWQEAFTTLHALSNSSDAIQSSVLVFSQFLHSACQLAHTMRISLSQVGFLYKQPIDDRLVLVSTAKHPGRLTETGLYRWAPKEVVDEFMTAQHGVMRGDAGNEKMAQILGEEYANEEEGGNSWTRELERYHQSFALAIDQRRTSPRTSVMDIRIAIPPPPVKPDDKPSSPRSRASSVRRQSSAVSPVSGALVAEAGGAVTAEAIAQERGRGLTSQVDVVRATEEAMRAERASVAATDDAARAMSAPVTPRSDGCQLHVGMFLARVTGTQLTVMLHRYGPSHIIPCIRLRISRAVPKTQLTDAETGWLAAQMQNSQLAPLPIAGHAASFPQSASSSEGDDLLSFQRAFLTAVAELSAVLGGGKHLAFSKLLSVHPVSLSSTVHMLVFCESVMTPHFPVGYDRSALTFMPNKVFEALHSAKWPNALPRDWISQALQSTTRSADRSRAWVQRRADFLHSQPFKQTGPGEQTTGAGTRTTSPRTGDRLLNSNRGTPMTSRATAPNSAMGDESRPTSAPGSQHGSRHGSKPASGATTPRSRENSASHSRRPSYEVKEKAVVVNGEVVTVVRVRDVDEEREKEERRKRRRERKRPQERPRDAMQLTQIF